MDAYLYKIYGEGLAERPIFSRKENLLDLITLTSDRVCFLLGATYVHTRHCDSVSRYDLKGLEELVRSPLSELRIEMEDVLLDMSMEEWNELISERQEGGRKKGKEALISFGTSKVNSASEYILADMIGAQAFSKNVHIDLPFYFVFPPIEDSEESWTSSFIFTKPLNPEVLGDNAFKKLKTMKSEQRAIIVLEKTFINETKEDEYGILIAQRKKPYGHVAIVLCGCHGPTTLSLSKTLAQGGISKNLPELDWDATHQPILTVVVKAEVEFQEDQDLKDRDVRKLLTDKRIRPPELMRLMRYDDKHWQWEKESQPHNHHSMI